MDNDRIKSTPLVSREDNEKFLGVGKKPENEREIQFLYKKQEREKNRRLRLYKEIARNIIAISMAGALAASIIGEVNSNKNTNNNQVEREYISQDVNYGGNATNEDNPYSPDKLVFDEIVQQADSPMTYRIVVNEQGDCAFVFMDYSRPFSFLDGKDCYDVARKLGYDFDSYSEGRSL